MNRPKLGLAHRVVRIIPTTRIRGLTFFKFEPEAMHPLRAAAKQSLEHPYGDVELLRVLQSFYRSALAHSATEYLGLTSTPVGRELDTAAPWATPLPWDRWTIAEARDRAQRGSRIDSAQYGLQLDVSNGWTGCGPADPSFVAFEARRLRYVLDVVASEPQQSAEQLLRPINVVRLRDAGSSDTYIVQNGQHRAAVLAAHGCNGIRCFVVGTVRRSQLLKWPNVRRGIFAPEEAEEVWCRVRDGSPPPWAHPWICDQAD